MDILLQAILLFQYSFLSDHFYTSFLTSNRQSYHVFYSIVLTQQMNSINK